MEFAAEEGAAERLDRAEQVRIERLLGSGNLEAARTRIFAFAESHAEDPDWLRLRATFEARSGEIAQARASMWSALQRSNKPALYRRHLNLLLNYSSAASDTTGMDSVFDRGVPCDDADDDLPPGEIEVVSSLANRLVAWRRFDLASSIVDAFGRQLAKSASGLAVCGIVKIHAGRSEDALADIRASAAIKPLSVNTLVAGAIAARNCKDTDLLRQAAAELLERFPLYVTRKKDSQRYVVGVTSQFVSLPSGRSRIPPLREVYLPGNSVRQIQERLGSRYRFVSVFVNSPTVAPAIQSAPRPDIVFNALADAEWLEHHGLVDHLKSVHDAWNRPVVNAVDAVLKTGKSAASDLYGHIDNLVVPAFRVFVRAGGDDVLADHVEQDFDYPVVVGSADRIGRAGRRLAGNRSELQEALSGIGADERVAVCQFVGNPGEGGIYRKFRAAACGDEIVLMHVEHDEGWKVGGRRSSERVEFYLRHPHLTEFERKTCSDPEGTLGREVMETLENVRASTALDLFGIEFDVASDGKVMLFESSAKMNLLPRADARVRYPGEPEERLLAAFDRLVERRAGG